MKKKMITLAAVLGSGMIQAQTNDWSWTFQWGKDTCGLLFADTNLTASVKAAIRDDIAKVYASVSTNDIYRRIYTPQDPEYGTFVGYVGTPGDSGCPREIGGWEYKLNKGNRYFYVDKELSDKYLTQIALTNQHKVAVGSLTNFLHTFNSTITNNVIPPESLQMWWSTKQEIPVSTTFKKKGSSYIYIEPDEVVKFWNQWSDLHIFVPSILNLEYKDTPQEGGLWCTTFWKTKSEGRYELGLDLVYRDGSWRMVFIEF
jgi:hypothetical protein